MHIGTLGVRGSYNGNTQKMAYSQYGPQPLVGCIAHIAAIRGKRSHSVTHYHQSIETVSDCFEGRYPDYQLRPGPFGYFSIYQHSFSLVRRY